MAAKLHHRFTVITVKEDTNMKSSPSDARIRVHST